MLKFSAKGKELEKFLPHRGRNLLLDSIDIHGEGDGRQGFSSLGISDGDGSGRDIFLETAATGRMVSAFAIVEHLALTSAVMIFRDIGEGKTPFFSTITGFSMNPGFDCRAGRRIKGLVVPLKGRGQFHRCKAVLLDDSGGEAASAEIMAVIMESGSSGNSEPGKVLEKPVIGPETPVAREVFRYKHRDFLFIDSESGRSDGPVLTARYTYPPGHPFAPGHFPGNPVMMGVSQWAAALDASVWLAHSRGLAPGSFRADCEIVREDGSAVCEVKGLAFTWAGAAAGTCPRILSTRRIGFRDVVKAGDTIYIRVSVEKTGGL